MKISHFIFIHFLLVVLTGCFARPKPQQVVEYGSEEATRLLAEEQGTEIQFSLPKDELPALASEYRFAPGDQLDLRLYGFPEHDRTGVKVDPSGCVSWLGLEPLPVSGQTVEAVRAAFEQQLKPLFRYPRVICKPRLLVGHRYHLLGKVVDRGSYPLDRPLTLLDAISRARGIETGLQNGTTIEIADFNHSFLIRNGQRIPIDFQALIQGGDLRYNIHVWPGDLIYFPSALSSEIYVLGNVPLPRCSGLCWVNDPWLGFGATRWIKRRSLCIWHPRYPWQLATSNSLSH